MKSSLLGPWIFEAGARLYDFFTGNPIWAANCARLLAHVPPQQGRFRVLDVGAGPGVSAIAVGQQWPQAHFIGLDFAPRMLGVAAGNRRKAGWPLARLRLVQADAFHLPLKDEMVDAVTGHSFLYLFSNYLVALTEAERVLRPGGYAAFLEPHAGQVSWAWLWGQASGRLFISISLWRLYSGWHRRFSPESLRLGLAQAGFTNITVEVTLGGFGIFGRAQKP